MRLHRPVARAARAAAPSPLSAGRPFTERSAVGASPSLPASAAGRPLPRAVAERMEESLGHDFSAVRVHQGPEAESLGALAFTRGEQIHFAPGTFRPESYQGRRLLAHELAHVVQQRARRVAVPAGPGPPVNDDPALEAEADRLGERAARGAPAVGRSAPAGGPATGTAAGAGGNLAAQAYLSPRGGRAGGLAGAPGSGERRPDHRAGCGCASCRRGAAPAPGGGFARALAAATAARRPALGPPPGTRPGGAPVLQLCPQCNDNSCNHGSKCGKLQYIPSRGSVNPTKRTKTTATVDDPTKFDSNVLPLVNKFVGNKGTNKNYTSDTQVDMAHRLGDKGLRRIFDDALVDIQEKPKLSKKRRKRRSRHLESVYDAVWDSSLQTSAQDKKVKVSQETLLRLVKKRKTPTKKELAQITTGVNELSKSSRRNLRPGSHPINVKISEAPDLVAYTKGKRKRSLSPVSDRIASVLDRHGRVYKKRHVETTVPSTLRRRKKRKKYQSRYKAKKGYTHSGGKVG